jgi:hypothetical protein
MDKSRRKELLREYAERAPSIGIFAVTCAPTGQVWVGWSKALDKRKNSLWFQWNAGGDAGAPDVRDAWKTYGADAFSYGILETIDEDNPHKLGLLLEERTPYWRGKLGAGLLPGL